MDGGGIARLRVIGGEGREQTTAAKQTTLAFMWRLEKKWRLEEERKWKEKIGAGVVSVWLPLLFLRHFFNYGEQTLLIDAT